MIKNYLIIALRTFSRQKVFTFINMSGLAVGLAGAFLITGYIINELNYDLVHPFAKQTYRIGTLHIEDGNENKYAAAPALWSEQLKQQYPEVKSILRTMWFGYPFSVDYREEDKVLLTEELFFVEENYSEVLYFETLEGNKETVFTEINSIALNESAAKNIFGDENPIGKSLVIQHPFATSNNELNLQVTAVFKDYPSNTHFKPAYLVNIKSMKSVIEWGNFDDMFTGWLQGWMSSFIVLEENADIDKISSGFTTLVGDNLPEDAAEFRPFLRKVNDLHFDKEVEWSSEGSGDIMYVFIFGSIAVLLIVIASINYMNMATARSVKRSREVGLRKVMGSYRSQLIFQFVNESFITTVLSMVLAIVLIYLTLPVFNSLAQKRFEFYSFFSAQMLVGMISIVLLVSILAGSYPAFFLSKFKPVQVLKGNKPGSGKSDALRRGLVILQFAISFFMIICTGVLLKQLNFLKSSKLNEQGQQIISIRYGGVAPTEKYPVYKNSILQDPYIEQVTMANHLPRQNYFGGIGVTVKVPVVTEQELQWNELNVDYNFPQTFNLELLMGRSFDEQNPADSNACLINESAIRNLGIETADAIGLSVEDQQNQRISIVIGVVKDFPYQSMHQSIGPLRISARPHQVDKIVYVKLPLKDMQSHIQTLEAKWKEVYPGIGFDYWFLDQEFGRMYDSEARMSDLTRSFSVLAIFIACLGLFGLASYMAEQQTKEIGIRKVLGATVKQILIPFMGIFLKMLLLSMVVAGPIAYFLMGAWLQQFVYHIDIDWKIMGTAVGIVFGLTILTVGYELVKASTANPARAIRYE